jgi:hypothetical protein
MQLSLAQLVLERWQPVPKVKSWNFKAKPQNDWQKEKLCNPGNIG